MMTGTRWQAAAAWSVGFFVVSVCALAQQEEAASPHQVRTAKFTTTDVEESSTFYQQMFEMTEFDRYISEGRLVEPFLGYAEDARLGLLGYTEQETIEKSPIPVAVIFTPDFDDVTGRLEAAQHPLSLLSGPETGGVRIAITRDPSGNALEIVEREGTPAVGGSRLVVDDRQKAEDFFVRIFGVAAGRRIETDTFDEVFMNVGGAMFVVLFEPKGATPLPKSKHPVVAIYSTDFDAVLERVVAEGLGHQQYGDFMFLANDPSGNVVEVVRQRAE